MQYIASIGNAEALRLAQDRLRAKLANPELADRLGWKLLGDGYWLMDWPDDLEFVLFRQDGRIKFRQAKPGDVVSTPGQVVWGTGIYLLKEESGIWEKDEEADGSFVFCEDERDPAEIIGWDKDGHPVHPVTPREETEWAGSPYNVLFYRDGDWHDNRGRVVEAKERKVALPDWQYMAYREAEWGSDSWLLERFRQMLHECTIPFPNAPTRGDVNVLLGGPDHGLVRRGKWRGWYLREV